MIKVGDIVLNEVNRSGKSKTQIAKDIKLSRSGLSKILARDEMEVKYVVRIGKSIRHDFSKHFPQINSELLGSFVNETSEEYSTLSNGELRAKMIELQSKYIKLLEEHVELLRTLKTND